MQRGGLPLLLLLLFFAQAKAQVNTSVEKLSVEGFITDDRGRFIENVHIVDISGNRGTTSNLQGQFRIAALPGDTIRFTCVGYIPFKYHVPPSNSSPVIGLHVVLYIDTIQIQGVTIFPWPADVRALKNAVLAMDNLTPQFPDLKLNDLRYKPASLPVGSPGGSIPGMANPGLTYTMQGPVTALYNAFSKAAKSQRKYEMLVGDDQKKIIATRRYNPQVVKQITAFKTDKEIQDFMLYCNLTVDFILRSSEYELYKAINECLLAYNDGRNADRQ